MFQLSQPKVVYFIFYLRSQRENCIKEFSIFDEIFYVMETASFNGLLKTIFYILAFYYIFKFLARLFLPVIAKKVVEKASEQFQQQQNYQQKTNSQSSNSEKPKEKKIVGEYVDFEEIE